jgi:mannosyl-3-phosphoglycerate phosphatase
MKEREDRVLYVVTDLDGTLLDERSYTFGPAVPAIERLRRAGGMLVLNSSKTAAEMTQIAAAIGGRPPLICENGAQVLVPGADDASPREQSFGTPRLRLLEVLAELRSGGARFQGFNDWSIDEIVRRTGLDDAAARRAAQRAYSEPIVWEGTGDERSAFLAALEARGLRGVQGGRFLSVQGRYDKREAMRWLCRDPTRFIVALGDSPNDAAMLADADLAVVVRSRRSHTLDLPQGTRSWHTLQPGPEGWRAALDYFLDHWQGDRFDG